MKATPQTNFPVRVRPEKYEVVEATAEHYTNIFRVTLNHEVKLTFVPNFSEVGRPLDSRKLPADIDTVCNVQEARLATAIFTRFVVTPDARRVGTVEQLADAAYDDPPTTFFYVSPEQYAIFAGELSDLADWPGDRDPSMRYENLLGYRVIEFIGHVFVESGYLSPYERKLLGLDSRSISAEESGED